MLRYRGQRHARVLLHSTREMVLLNRRASLGEGDEVLLLSKHMAVFIRSHLYIGVDIGVTVDSRFSSVRFFLSLSFIFVAGYVGFIFRAVLGLLPGGLAQRAGTVDVLECAGSLFVVCTMASAGVIRTLKDMTIVTIRSLGAIAKSGEGTANTCGGRDVNMGIAACIVGAVATLKVRARGHAVIGQFVGHVACLTSFARARAHELFADGNFFGIVGEFARGAENAGT